jgi:superfamily II DNA or RNA helicase
MCPVRYDDFIKKPDLELEYTEEQITEIIKCKEDFYYFCKYITIVETDTGRGKFIPRDYQIELFNLILNNRFTIAKMARQSGKCLLGSTLISIRNKKTGAIEKISMLDFYNKINKPSPH